mmetsp:Transcript_22842/g.49928  ORF Transcript_22842/g.49928 Transcript_22842/m.49928 type:complete len:250 (+) Transcript_22842:391-1140(+)
MKCVEQSTKACSNMSNSLARAIAEHLSLAGIIRRLTGRSQQSSRCGDNVTELVDAPGHGRAFVLLRGAETRALRLSSFAWPRLVARRRSTLDFVGAERVEAGHVDCLQVVTRRKRRRGHAGGGRRRRVALHHEWPILDETWPDRVQIDLCGLRLVNNQARQRARTHELVRRPSGRRRCRCHGRPRDEEDVLVVHADELHLDLGVEAAVGRRAALNQATRRYVARNHETRALRKQPQRQLVVDQHALNRV